MSCVFERAGTEEAPGELWSDRCQWAELAAEVETAAGRSALDLGDGWARRWTVTWRTGAGEVTCAVRDPDGLIVSGLPMRRFSWRRESRRLLSTNL